MPSASEDHRTKDHDALKELGAPLTARQTHQRFPELYHYTNETGLYGILNSNCLWATHFRYLNDTSEMLYPHDPIMRGMIPDMLENPRFQAKYGLSSRHPLSPREQMGMDQAHMELNSDIKRFMTPLINVDAQTLQGLLEPFFISFFGYAPKTETSKKQDAHLHIDKNGLLSQWRGYGYQQSRYAIVFNTQKLEDMFVSSAHEKKYRFLETPRYLMPVGYGLNVEEWDDALQEMYDRFKRAYFIYKQEKDKKPGIVPIVFHVFDYFYSIFPRFKHIGFHEENEVRFVYLRRNDDIRIDPFSKTQFKHVHYDFPKPHVRIFEEDNTPLPIERIIVGPTKNRMADTHRLKGFLAQKGMEKIPVFMSDIPFND